MCVGQMLVLEKVDEFRMFATGGYGAFNSKLGNQNAGFSDS